MTRFARLAVLVLFAALLSTPFLIRRFSQPARATAASAGADPLAQYGFRLTESAKAAGLDFVHGGPTLDSKLAHIMPQVASMGAAVSVVDVDRDGLSDLYVTDSREGSRNRLFRNRGNGTFEDVAERLGVADLNRADTGVSMGAVWGDYDNDGFEDSSSIAGAARISFTTIAARASRARPSRPGCPRGRTSTRRCGSTSIATACSICSSAATTPSR